MSRTHLRNTRGHCDRCHRTSFCLRRVGSRALCAACLSTRAILARAL